MSSSQAGPLQVHGPSQDRLYIRAALGREIAVVASPVTVVIRGRQLGTFADDEQAACDLVERLTGRVADASRYLSGADATLVVTASDTPLRDPRSESARCRTHPQFRSDCFACVAERDSDPRG